ncbi:MAG: hypothetical protein A2017_18275 [Lentisphaerae bacterium GWF2_44_16]|nr:MAG: hypothetical protein A2017_18275 [Lentisphaerae bacterium GWF2_44_16]
MPDLNIVKIENMLGLSEPAKAMVKKCFGLLGLWIEPNMIKRKADALKYAAETQNQIAISNTKTQIEIEELCQRTRNRFENEEIRKQINMENIIEKALPLLSENSTPENIDNDWLFNFFDKCKLISNEEMQMLWAKILAGEADKSGAFSKRTINIVQTLSKKDAEYFTKICSFVCKIYNELRPIILDHEDEFYKKNGLNFDILKHLEDIGLLNFDSNTLGMTLDGFPKIITICYLNEKIKIEFKNDNANLERGQVLFTETGKELSQVCKKEPIDGFSNYLITYFKTNELNSSSPIKNISIVD